MKHVVMTSELRKAVKVVHKEFTTTSAGWSARPYAEGILQIPDGGDKYIADDLDTLLIYLIDNLKNWKGETARQTKVILRKAGK